VPVTNGCLPPYVVPNELQTFEDYARRYHADLGRLSDEDLWGELVRVRIALAHSLADPKSRPWHDYDGGWLRQRLDRVRLERRRRRKVARQRPRQLLSTGGVTIKVR
jgi:hypothetical protein